jgi:hypothetical protein
MKTKKFNFFQKIYWGWCQVNENFFEWSYRMTEEDYWDADFWIGLNIDLSYVLETSFFFLDPNQVAIPKYRSSYDQLIV